MTLDNMRSFIKNVYPANQSWQKKVDAMPDEQVIAIFMNPHVPMPKNLGLSQAKETFSNFRSGAILRDYRTDGGVAPDYRICPHCGARLDRNEECDCYRQF